MELEQKGNTARSGRVEWIDYFKGFGIILVVLGHCFLPPAIRKLIYSFHMPLFFFAGGLTLNPSRYSSISEFIKKKAKGLLIPYLVINLCTILSWIYFEEILGSSDVSLGTLLYGIVYSNNDSIPLLNGPTWFITTLFLSELVFYLMYQLCKGKTEILLVASFASAVLGYAESIAVNGIIRPWHFSSVPVAELYVCAGFLFARAYKENGYQKIKEKVSWIWIIGLFALGFCAQHVNAAVSFGGNKYKSMDLTLVASMALIFGLVFFCMKMPKSRFLAYAGMSSMIWLALHKSILFWIRYHWPNTKINYISSLKGIVLLFAIMIPLSYIIDRYFPFVVGKWSDKKSNKIGVVIYVCLTVALCIKVYYLQL